MYWYNPKTRAAESTSAPSTDAEATAMLAGHLNSTLFITEYESLRGSGMGVEKAMICVGHKFWLKQLEYQPVG